MKSVESDKKRRKKTENDEDERLNVISQYMYPQQNPASFFLNDTTPNNKRVPEKLKRAVWDVHVGPLKKEDICPLCGIEKMTLSSICGYEAAHIVSASYISQQTLSVLYLLPSCRPCNNKCSNLCLLDFLFENNRLSALKKIIMSIYNAFVELHKDNVEEEDKLAPAILVHLYGKERFPAGGGLQYKSAICEIARVEHLKQIRNEMAVLFKKTGQLTLQAEKLCEREVRDKLLFNY